MAALAGLAAAGMLSGCAAPPASRELRVGFIIPESGPFAPYGVSHLEGARLAVAEANRGKGLVVKGRRYTVVLVERDSSNSAEKALAAAQELVNREGVAAIIGPMLSGQAIPVAHLVDRSGIPMITQIATNPEVTRGTRGVFRVCYTDDFQGRAMARFAFGRLRARRAAVLFDVANVYNSGVAGVFSREMKRLGGEVVASETYTTGEEDFRGQLRRIRDAHPDALFLPNFANEVLPQIRQMRELGIAVPVVGGDAMSYSEPGYVAAIEGAWYSVHFSADNPGTKTAAFLAAYQEVFRHVPDQGVALSYDALSLLLEVVRARQSVDPREIADGLRAMDVFEGVTGRMVFHGSPDPRKSVVVVRMENGAPRFQTRIEP